jgi:AraC-like DNA-binding protein
VKFFSVVTRRTTLSFEEAGGLGILRQHPVPGQPRGAILTEFPFVSLALRARHATDGRFALRAVRFAHRSDHAAAYREAFGCDVTFRAARDELEIESAMLDLSLASADPITAAALEARVAELTRGSVRSPLVERVRRAALATLAHGPSLDSLARQLAVSARTLRRQLAQEHTTVRAIVDEVRRERADHLLAQGEAVKAVASALGFSEASAFSRAYKRWTGRPPG